MNRRKRLLSFFLCLSLCFFIGCGKNASDEETETGSEAYTEWKENRETEYDMENQQNQETEPANITEEQETETKTMQRPLSETTEADTSGPDSVPDPEAGQTAENTETEEEIPGETVEQGTEADILLTQEEIKERNRISFGTPGNGMVDLETFSPQTAEEIRAMVEEYSIPNYPYYDGRPRTGEDDAQLLASRNLEQITDPVHLRYGILTKNAAVRSFPTEKTMTKEGKPDDFDYLQESMFSIGEGVTVCHQTADQSYSFVQGYQYKGWIPTDAIGFCSKEEMMGWLRMDPPVVITDAAVTVHDVNLRMGTALPAQEETESGYQVRFPMRREDGSLTSVTEEIPKTAASLGYLAYTKDALLNQAYQLIGQPYGWGDTDEKMDCSSTMNSIFETFGIQMPRNTSQLTLFSAKVTDLSAMSAEEKEAAIREAGSGSMILLPGHVVMYVGETDGVPQILHNVTAYSLDGGALETAMECRVTPLAIYNTGGIRYLELFTAIVEIE